MPEYDIIDFAKTQLTLPDKIDPADEMSWQHYLYSQLGSKKSVSVNMVDNNGKNQLEETVDRIVAMSKVLYGLHMASICFLFIIKYFIRNHFKLVNKFGSICFFVFLRK